jgi:putative protease
MRQPLIPRKIELLAPAGSPEAFYASIHAGADAVYLGGKQFGARAYATNFTEDELIKCITYAHIEGRKVYLTLNTLIKEKEFVGLYQYLLPYVTAGLDAVIVQDMGVLSFVRRNFPGLSIHASTQMSQTGIQGIRILQELGVTRVVPARELSLEELQSIKEHTNIELEVFIHGAMCYSYSGQCLFSSMLGGRSGNRGCCAQPCRLPYQICLSYEDAEETDITKNSVDQYVSKEAYYLSLKDLYTLPLLPKLLELGIDSLKIEGRMKKPEYSASVTGIYRKYIDRYRDGKWILDPRGQEILTKLYMRSEQQSGYLQSSKVGDMVTLTSPAYSENDEELLQEIRKRYSFVPKKHKVNIYGSFLEGSPASLTITYEDKAGCAYGDVVAAARTKPVSSQAVSEQLTKLGDTIWEADEVHLTMDGHSFLPVSEIKKLRREALARLEEQLMQASKPIELNDSGVDPADIPTDRTIVLNGSGLASTGYAPARKMNNNLNQYGLGILCTTPRQLQALIDNLPPNDTPISGIYLEGDICFDNDVRLQLAKLKLRNFSLYLVLPPILRKEDAAYADNCLHLLKSGDFNGCMVRSLEGYGYLKSQDKTIITDHHISVWNKETLTFWQNRIERVTLPLECNRYEQITLWEAAHEMNLPMDKVVYGRIPMMVTANCIAKTIGKCVKTEGSRTQAALIDRYRKRFPVRLNCSHCMNIIYNSVPLSLHKEIAYWQDKVNLRLDFTVENKEETGEVLQWAYVGFPSKLPSFLADAYTTGHEAKVVI